MAAQKPKPVRGNEGKWIDGFAPVFCIGYFLLLAGGNGLQAFFTGDDVTNLVHLHGCFDTPFLEILQQALTVATGAYRPIGGLFYRLLYSLFGFDPLPFRVAAFALMGVNLLLAYRLVRILSGSRAAALAATFLLSCNASFIELYHSTGTIYDILCFGFFVGAFSIYAASRSNGKIIGRKRWFYILVLYCCALGSKEMAVTFPLVLILYEFVYRPQQFRPRDISAGLRKPHFFAIAGLSILTIAYAAVKLASENPISINPAYSPAPSLGKFAASLNHYLPRWLYLADIGETRTLALAAAAAIAACALRARSLLFGVLFVIATLLPLAFIPPRGGFAFYLPSLGCALFLGSAASLISRNLFSSSLFDRALPVRFRTRRNRIAAALQGVGFLAFAAFLTPAHRESLKDIPGYYDYEHSRKILSDLKAVHPNFPEGAAIYFEDDPYPQNVPTLAYLMQLGYEDPTLHIDRGKIINATCFPYDFFFTFREGRVEAVPPAFSAENSSPENIVPVYFQPTDGKPGEAVSVQVKRFAGKEIDVYWRHAFADGRPRALGAALRWCAVDIDGFCTVSLPKDFPRGRIEILCIREAAAQTEWHTAQGVLDVR